MTDLALVQIPEAARRSTPILISADGAGSTKDWLAHLRGLRERRGPPEAALFLIVSGVAAVSSRDSLSHYCASRSACRAACGG